jgi:hypothetical protein
MALQLVRACHDGATDEMLQQIQSAYTEWHSSNRVGHLGIYWNMRIRKFVWLNGFHDPQLEILVPSILGGGDNTLAGFGHTMHRQRLKLDALRHTVVSIP